jgi:hypothetical protein
MPTHGTTENAGLGATVKQVAEHASAVARLEMELAAMELKRKVTSLGLGLGLAVGAAFFALFGIGFGLATVAAALAIFLDTWLALLIVFGGLMLVTLVLALLALGRIRKGTPPVPEQAIEEARLTTEAIKRNGS